MAILAYLFIANPSGTATLDPRARIFGHTFFRIPSSSMAPTITSGNLILVETFVYRSNSPARGDIIAFRHPLNPSQSFLKRVIGVAGDSISINDHRLWLNGEEYDESYTQHKNKTRHSSGEWTVPEGQLFVLGDNRDNSSDSRHWGLVNVNQVIGKVRNTW